MNNKTCGWCRFYHPIFKHEGVCTATSELRKTCDFTNECAIGGVYPKPPPTNGDVIRQGGNDALIDFADGIRRRMCHYCVYSKDKSCVDKTGDCWEGVRAWLNAPAESEGEDE